MAEKVTWVDDQPVDPAWAPPGQPPDSAAAAEQSSEQSSEQDQSTAQDPGRSGRIGEWLPIGIPVLVAVLVIALVAAFGGFKQRTDLTIEMPAGSMIETGPYQLRFEKATIQQVTEYGDKEPTQQVIVFGTGVNTWTEAIAPKAEQFAASDPAGTETKDAEAAHLSTWLDGPRVLTPELPPQPLEIEFVFSGDFEPGDQLRFLASDLTYGDHSFLGVGGQEEWYNHGDRYLMRLPLERLPDLDEND